jgi:two-component sensor histidine kinase
MKDLLLGGFAAYGEKRLQLLGPDFDIGPESARHLALLFHELATNAAKYGALSRPDGEGLCRVALEWHQALFDLEGTGRADAHAVIEQAGLWKPIDRRVRQIAFWNHSAEF